MNIPEVRSKVSSIVVALRKTAEQLGADLSISLFCGLGGATTFFIRYVIYFKSVLDYNVSI